MRAVLRPLGTLLILTSLAGLALLAAGPSGGSVETTLVTDPSQEAAQLGDAASQTSTPTQELSSRAAESPAGEPAELPPTAPLPSSRVLLDEGFADNRMRWPDDSHSTAWISGPGYRLAPREPGRFVAVSAPIPVPLVDVVVP